MGSASDLPVMEPAVKVLENFGIPYEIRVISAHRTPHLAHEYASTAEARGLKVLIAGAGRAAHLAGVLASLTVLPVIGVPVLSGALNGMDSLLSTVQMPPGVPVATVGIDSAENAGLLAVQILATGDPVLRDRLREYKLNLAEKVKQADQQIRQRSPVRAG